MVDRLKSAAETAAIRIYTAWVSFKASLRKYGHWFSYAVLSSVGSLIAWWLYRPEAQAQLREFKDLTAISTAVGGLVGTMLVLALTLSMIPIQRTVENFTPSITRLYREDGTTQLIFGLLATFSLLSFAAAVFAKSSTRVVPLEILSLALSLDLLRWYHRHTITLLGSSSAIDRMLRQITRHIDHFQRTVARLAWIKWWALPSEQRTEKTRMNLEAIFYAMLGDRPLQTWLSELAESGQRATARGETNTVRMCAGAVGTVVSHYLNRRARNLILVPKALLVLGTDADELLTAAYEHLSDINRGSVVKSDEIASIDVLRTFTAIAVRTANLGASAFSERSAPITAAPIIYIIACAERAQNAGMTNVSLEASALLRSIIEQSPANTQITDVHVPAINGLAKLALALFTAGATSRTSYLANEPIKELMSILNDANERRHFQLDALVRVVTEKFQQLAPLAIAYEKGVGALPYALPLAPPYDLTEGNSFGYLVERAASSIVRDEHEWANPYHDFIRLNNVISEHFRRLPEKVNLGASFLTWHITQTIKHIARVHLGLIGKPVSNDERHLEELLRGFLWYLPFLWLVFRESPTIDYQRASDACDALSFIGMAYLDAGYSKVAKDSATHIASITDSYCRTSGAALNLYNVADLMLPIWYMRLAAEAKGDTALVADLDGKIAKPESLATEVWEQIGPILELRRRQLEEDLTQDRFPGDDARALLRDLLANAG